ncbi:hypothetical protein BSU04_34980 [Caballeronia sordidicola]|uniref:Uncharacterized protein n=1 Tax=Caballeronia sordidicola TaxID=196367 RepID=A0A226WRM9_CABSO|nr:hypothetical protein BSU04_34980 [Caballeronia sordidicola]
MLFEASVAASSTYQPRETYALPWGTAVVLSVRKNPFLYGTRGHVRLRT